MVQKKKKKTQQEGTASTDIQNKLPVITAHTRPPRRNVWYICVRTQERRENKHLDMIPSDGSSKRLGKHQTPHQLSGERNECGATSRVQEFGAAAAQTFLGDNGGYVTEMLIWAVGHLFCSLNGYEWYLKQIVRGVKDWLRSGGNTQRNTCTVVLSLCHIVVKWLLFTAYRSWQKMEDWLGLIAALCPFFSGKCQNTET